MGAERFVRAARAPRPDTLVVPQAPGIDPAFALFSCAAALGKATTLQNLRDYAADPGGFTVVPPKIRDNLPVNMPMSHPHVRLEFPTLPSCPPGVTDTEQTALKAGPSLDRGSREN